MPVLRIKLPENKGEIIHLLAGERITIGRRPENTIQIIDRTVSAHHAELISINGHYRLHDLGSTNLTCVEGQPVADYHLHHPCKLSFGTVQCEFSPDTPINTIDKSEVVPTRAELEYLRRENQDLQAKMAGMQKQIDILSSARLMTKDTQQLGVLPDVHRRVQMERDEARHQVANLTLDLENLRGDVASLIKERDALRLAWETVKQERDALPHGKNGNVFAPSGASHTVVSTADKAAEAPVTAAPPAQTDAKPTPEQNGVAVEPAMIAVAPILPVAPAPSQPPAPRPSDTVRITTTGKSPVDHRAMAMVLTKAPAALKAMRASLETLQTCDNPDEASQNITNLSAALAEALAPANGHSAQRLAAACAYLVKDARSRPWTFEPGITRTLLQAAEVIGALLDPRVFRKAAEAPVARALVIDDDPELLKSVTDALKSAEIRATPCRTTSEGLEMLAKEGFDLVLLDTELRNDNGIELCSRIRELPTHQTTPVVFMSVDNGAETRNEMNLRGGDDFMPKPLNARELAVKASTWVVRQQCGIRN
jgi:CheY-like chemotaxis protein/FtsZ-binding cell division protein ZapB